MQLCSLNRIQAEAYQRVVLSVSIRHAQLNPSSGADRRQGRENKVVANGKSIDQYGWTREAYHVFSGAA